MTTRRFMAALAMAALGSMGLTNHTELLGQSRGQAERRMRYRNNFYGRAKQAVKKIKRNRARNKVARASRVYNLKHA